MLGWYSQATKWGKEKKSHCLGNSLTANLRPAKKCILDLSSCSGDHKLTSVSCTNKKNQ